MYEEERRVIRRRRKLLSGLEDIEKLQKQLKEDKHIRVDLNNYDNFNTTYIGDDGDELREQIRIIFAKKLDEACVEAAGVLEGSIRNVI